MIVSNNKKNIFVKMNSQERDKIILNYKENNIQVNSKSNNFSKKLDLITLTIRKTKYLIEQKINCTIFNTQNQSRSDEKRKNKFLFGEKSLGRNTKTSRNNIKNINDNIIFNPSEKLEKDFPTIKKEKENKFANVINNNKTFNDNAMKNNIELNLSNDFVTRSNKDLFPSLYIIEKNSNQLEFIVFKIIINL